MHKMKRHQLLSCKRFSIKLLIDFLGILQYFKQIESEAIKFDTGFLQVYLLEKFILSYSLLLMYEFKNVNS